MADALDALRKALADRYAVERELGRGGNAVVYLARDLKHDRQVALKVLLPELALAVRTERFFREIQIAAKLSHPHILTLIDSGQSGEFLYYVMPYVEGESLRDQLNREKQLPLEDALQITREVAGALGYAHEHGVVHRDIKPENILLHGGHAVVMDFGIARALTAAGGGTITEAGIAVGTPAYMSPEQGAGSGEPDARSDIYSLGCVLYEMLAGHPPFTGATAQEILGRHVLDPVPTVRAVRPNIPQAIQEAIEQALAKHPADRFATVSGFIDALSPLAPRRSRRHLLVYGTLGLAFVLGLLVAWRTLRGRVSSPSSVAVLPFANLTTDSADAYFSAGMTDEIANALAHVEGLRVVPVSAEYLAARGNGASPQQIGRELRISRILGGSVRKSGPRLRVFARLLNASDGSTVWSEQFDRELKDVFDLQEGLARAVVAALQPQLSAAQAAPAARRYTNNLKAYDLYLRGRYFVNRSDAKSTQLAIEYFGRALALDSAYALAWSGLADAYLVAGFDASQSRDQLYRQGKAAALRALQLDSMLAEAHVSLARVYQSLDWDWAGAEREFQRAIQLNPRYGLAHSWYANLLGVVMGVVGRSEDAVREGRLGAELDPLSARADNNLGLALYLATRYDEAIDYFRRTIDLAPDWGIVHLNLGRAYARTGRLRQALQEFQTYTRLGGQAYHGALGEAYALAGERAEALKVAQKLLERDRPSQWQHLAWVHAALGERDQAFEALEQALETRSAWAVGAALSYPVYQPLRSDPRFSQLLRKAGLIQ